jgi:HEAT repeats
VTWTRNVVVSGQLSKASPALAEYDGHLHMVHLGDSSNTIWHSEFDGNSWTANTAIPDQRSKASPALAGYDGQLHMVHLGDSSNDIWWSMYDGTSWNKVDGTPGNERIPEQQSKAAPALAACGDAFHMVHLGDSSNDIWWSIYDGTSWNKADGTPGNERIPGQRSKATPALAAFGDTLHMVHLGDSSNRIWHSEFDGNSWTTNRPIADQLSKAPPALATFEDLCARERLHIAHLGDTSNRIWHSEYDGRDWTRNFYLADQFSKSAPALSPFASRLHLVHLGDTTNKIWHTSYDGLTFAVRLGLKVLVDPARFSFHTMLYEMATVYATADFRVVELQAEELDLPDLEIVDVGDCKGTLCPGDGSTDDQATLFSNRNGLGPTDVAAYFVDSTVKALNGCALHPVDVPACIVTKNASRWTLGHEVGHVLCLPHVMNDSDNLMTGGGTDNVTNAPPDLTADQISTMQDAASAIDCRGDIVTLTSATVVAALTPDEPDYSQAAATFGEAALPHLAELVRSADPLLAAKATSLAGTIGGAGAVEVILEAARHDEIGVRAAAAYAARGFSEQQARPVLLALMDDDHPSVVKQAVVAAGGSRDKDVRAKLRDLESSHESAAVREAARRALNE